MLGSCKAKFNMEIVGIDVICVGEEFRLVENGWVIWDRSGLVGIICSNA